MTNTEKALQHYRAMLKAQEECLTDVDIAIYAREAIAALEKQTPMRAYFEYDNEFMCPACGYEDDPHDVTTLKVCPKCGQRLKWEE